MSLISPADLATKIPFGIGSSIELYGIRNNYRENTQKIEKKYNRINQIKKGLETKKKTSSHSGQNDELDATINRLSSKIQEKDNEIKQAKKNALLNAGVVFLQEGANAVVPGAGSVIAGISQVRSTVLDDNDEEPNLIKATKSGVFVGIKDYGLSTIADVASNSCTIM